MDNETLATKILATLVILGILLLLAVPAAHCSASSPRTQNSLGVVLSDVNPYVYNVGVMTTGTYLYDSKGRISTNIGFAPYGNHMLYPENLLFCGDVAQQLLEHQQTVIVLVYGRQAHSTIEGIGCHELLTVKEIK